MKTSQRFKWFGLVGLGGFLLVACESGRQETSAPEMKPVPVKALIVRAAPQEQLYEAAGAVRARQRAVLASKLQATILAVPVKLGDAVKPGQLVVELDHGETDAELSRAQASVAAAESGIRQAEKAQAAAQAEAQLARTTLARFRQLFDKKSVSQQEFDQAEARNSAAQAAVEMATARIQETEAQRQAAAAALESARLRQEYTRITAPFAGFVAEKNADAGTVVASGTPLLTVEDSSSYQLEVSLPESQLAAVKIGDIVQVNIPAVQIETAARVAEMEPGAQAGSRSSLIRIALPAAKALRSGLFGRALFSLGKANTLTVPEETVLRQGQLRFVYVVADGKARRRLVTLGRIDKGNAEVLSGLSEGEQIATSGLSALADGSPVEIQP